MVSEVNIIQDKIRLMFILETEVSSVTALYDSGAIFPVWCGSVKELELKFGKDK